MDSSASGTPTCPTCGSARAEGHTCPPSHLADPEDTGRFQIPEALRNTGLFRAAWRPTSTPDAPETLGSIFERVEEPAPAAPTAAPDEDPWAHLDVKVVDPVTAEAPANPWAALSTPPESSGPDSGASESAASEPIEVLGTTGAPETSALSPIAAAEAAALGLDAPSGTDVPAEDVLENEHPATENPATENPADENSADEIPPADALETGELELTAAFSVEGAFAAEAAVAASWEQVPEPAESAYDLYGDTLYAPAEELVGVSASAEALTQAVPDVAQSNVAQFDVAQANVAQSDTSFVPGLSADAITSASLPDSVPFAAGADGNSSLNGPDQEAAEKPRRTKAVLAAVLAVVLVAGAGAWWWTSQKDGPVKDAFAASHGSFSAAAVQMQRASSIEEVAAAGAAFESTVAALNTTAEETRENSSGVSVAARRATLAETAVAEAAAPLAELSTQDLSPWANSRSAFADALDNLSDVHGDIETAGGSTDGLPTAELVTTISDVIAEEIVAGASASVVDLSAKLEASSLLADVRAVGASAGEYVAPLTAAAEGLEDEEQKDDLLTVVGYHEGLKGFTQLRPATFDQWDALLKDARKAAKKLATGKEEALAGLTAADKLVGEARKTFEAWETKHAKAEARKSAEATALAAAAAAVESTNSAYSELQADLEGLVRTVAGLDPTANPGEAFALLDGAAQAREDLLATLTGRDLVPSATKKLEPLVAALSADAEAVRAAATAAQACTEGCRITNAPAWKSMLSTGKDSATAWGEALEPWKQTVETATQKIKDRELPERPKI